MPRKTKKTGLPLTGIRVVDATNSWSGPFTTGILANLGAQVIKVESIQYIDTWRGSGTAAGAQDDFWERSPLWNSVNCDKLGITLNLTHPKGVALFKRLVTISDIVAENFAPRVIRNFGLNYPVLREVNPNIIMISLPAHGTTGPWSDYTGFAASIEQMAGIPQLTGYPDGPPKMSGSGFTDPIAGVNGASALMIALLYRQMTGKGQHIDLSQVEATASLLGEAIVDYSMNQRIQPRRGNRHPLAAPHGCYRCRGEDQWLDLAVYNDTEWKKFCRAIGNPKWTKEPEFATTLSRWQNQDEMDKLVEQWTMLHDHYEVMHALQKAGITAGAVLNTVELLNDPHLKARGTFNVIDRAVVGTHPCPVPTAPMKFSGLNVTVQRPAPTLGQHNEYVLGEILGISSDEIKKLAEEKVIGNRPVGF